MLVALVCLPLLVMAAAAWVAWREAWTNAAAELRQTAEAVAEFGQRTLSAHSIAAGRVDAVLRGLSDQEIRAREAELHEELKALVAELPQTEAGFVISRTGEILVSANIFPTPRGRPIVADRDFFTDLSGPNPPAIHVSRVYTGRLEDVLFFAISRPRTRTGNTDVAPGAFDGLVNMSVYPNRLAEGLRQFTARHGDALSLLRMDGELLARSHGQTGPLRVPAEHPFHAAIATGATRQLIEARSAFDGDRQLVALRRIEGWPVVASAARPRATIVADWRSVVARQQAIGLPATLALVGLALLVRRSQRRLEAMNATLETRVAERAAEVAEREALLSAIGDSTPDAVFAKDRDGRLLYANRAALAIYGLTAERALGRTDAELLDKQTAAAVSANEARIIGRGVPEMLEETVLDAAHGRRPRTFLSAKAPLRDAAGEVVGVVGVARDMTEERAAQHALAEAKQRLEVVMQGAGLGGWRWHIPSGHVEFDARWAAMLGYELSEIEPSYATWERLVHPDDKAVAQAASRAHFEGRTPFSESETRLRHRDGHWIWVLSRASVVERDAEGRPVVVTGTHLDITARRETEAALAASEERLAMASAAAKMGVWDLEIGAATTVINSEFCRLYGLPADQRARSVEDWLASVHPDDRKRVRAAASAAIEANSEYRDEFRIHRRDTGAMRWIASRGRVVRMPGRPARFIGVNYDITERRAEQERQALLTREVDHRARNVLAVVRSIVKLTRAEDPKRFAEAVEGRVAALARAHTLLSRGGWTGALLCEVVGEEVAAYGGADRIALDGPELRLAPEAVQPLSMILHELATNAAKHGALSQPGGRVQVSWRLQGTRVALSWIERDGPPLLAPPSRRGFGSTVVEATARGQLSGSATFHWDVAGLRCEVLLPADRILAARGREETTAPAPEAPDGVADAASISLRGRRVLVVEDEPLVALETVAALTELGCIAVGPAATLEDGLRLAAAERDRLDAAVLDVNLAGRASFPIADLLAGAAVPVIHVTGYGALAPVAATGAPAPLLLTKPLSDGELAAALRHAIAARSPPQPGARRTG
ncbi:PAS domain-containing protein [Falsiroseomonas oryziterrae]|uniref:PAS domain-containing protein n=1 Tax=Falsiroseomonas oryziterrae TaxID=2911368 RepID=UPI001EFFD815|nr:PAS domain-containing protein [Roseomonas sp. NPKOSM-4]